MTRGRKPLISPSTPINVHLDAQLLAEIDERLWSDAEQRIPKGAYKALFTEALVRFLRQKPLDLAPYMNSLPSEHVIYAFEGTRDALKTFLESGEKE